MRLVKPSVLRKYYRQHKDAEVALGSFIKTTREAKWRNTAEVRQVFGSADFVGDRVVIDINGNRHRLIIIVRCRIQTVFIRFIGTHAQYDDIDDVKKV